MINKESSMLSRHEPLKQWVYNFGGELNEGNASMKNLLGGKGAGLAEMASIGLPVPPGFTISTEACLEFYQNHAVLSDEIKQQIVKSLLQLEKQLDCKFADNSKKPLLLAVRSGARSSMPGMMDTILNIGLNDYTVEILASLTGNAQFAYDSYRRLIQMYADVVLGIEHKKFENILNLYKKKESVQQDSDLTLESLKKIVKSYKKLCKTEGKEFPENVFEQLWQAIYAVFNSWENERAIKYRNLNNIPHSWGTAVNIQSMVFGNFGETSATGVCFSRNPSTGENTIFGEFLINAQGEDIVAGIRTPAQIDLKGKEENFSDDTSLEEAMPEVYPQLCTIAKTLEMHFKDMQDIEFTVQNNKLWILQARSGKRNINAAIKIANDMVSEGLISKQEAILKIDPKQIDTLLHPTIDFDNGQHTVLMQGLPASPGAASGNIVLSSEAAENNYAKQKIILVREETSPEDIGGISLAEGIITCRGGLTSHAAVVARGMGKPCIVGANKLLINERKKTVSIGNITLKEGDEITINGTNGQIILGTLKTRPPVLSNDFQNLMSWVNDVKALKVRANADTAKDAEIARQFGVDGIGLCRTEHMFFEQNRIPLVRKMILAESKTDRMSAIDELYDMQKQDFKAIFEVMQELPVTIRLLDPPLHEFLPNKPNEIKELAAYLNKSQKYVISRAHQLKEFNPMLGHRGVRLGITFPEIYEMQIRAIFSAVAELKFPIEPEIMVPLVLDVNEFKFIRQLIEQVAAEFTNVKQLKYKIGTMIELPRAVLKADELAKYADFFSFGTNDLTQTTMGLSRDDSAKFIKDYLDKGIFNTDPFVTIDRDGVGELIKLAIIKGKQANPELKLGVCGEHAGDHESIEFFNSLGLDYISCSPYRLPLAKLSAAQATLKNYTSSL